MSKAKPDKAVIVVPHIVKEGSTPEGLSYITIQLRRRKLTLTEPKYGVDKRRSVHVREALEIKIEDKDEKNEFILLYSAMAAISTGDVPNAKQFLELADADEKFWRATARRIAPHMFDWLTEQEALIGDAQQRKDALKKKGRQPNS